MQIENGDEIIQSIIQKHNLQNKDFITPQEAARIMGWSLDTAYRKLKSGRIKHVPRKPKEDYQIYTKLFIIDFFL